MRRKPKKPCAKAGCGAVTRSTYCEKHQREKHAHDRHRPNANARGYDHHWRKLREWFLNENPLCVFCLESGRVTEATDVDHIKSIKEYPELRLDPSNLRSLCHSCHSKRTYRDQGLGKKTDTVP